METLIIIVLVLYVVWKSYQVKFIEKEFNSINKTIPFLLKMQEETLRCLGTKENGGNNILKDKDILEIKRKSFCLDEDSSDSFDENETVLLNSIFNRYRSWNNLYVEFFMKLLHTPGLEELEKRIGKKNIDLLSAEYAKYVYLGNYKKAEKMVENLKANYGGND